MIGRHLGPYRIISKLGEGGMGEVYRARDSRLDRDVAIKVLPPAASGDPERQARFTREARTISRLSHPNICALLDVGVDGGEAYLVMELIEGQTLADRLRQGPLPIDEAVAIGHDVAAALRAAHGYGIVHRDLKPGNVMLTRSGAKLLDFGLAKFHAAVAADDASRSGLRIRFPGRSATSRAIYFGRGCRRTARVWSS
jgi:serine/threonine protein kinase